MAVNRLIRYSQFSATEIGNEIKVRYGMEELSSCRFFDNGLNDIYQIIVGEQKYYFRISLANIHERKDYEEEVQAILLFSKNGIGVAKPLPMTNGQYIWELEAPEGRRYGVLFEEAKQSSSFDSIKKVRLIGEHLALIHQCSDQNQLMIGRKEIDFEALREMPLYQVKQYLSHRTEDYRYLVEASEQLVAYIEKKVSKASPTYGFCHGDLHSGNVHFDGVSPAIFDFDCMGVGYRAYDICIYAWNESYGNPDYLESEEWAAFLDGYESVRKIEPNEKEVLISFMALRQIWLMGLHADVMDKNAGCSWYNDAYFDEQIGIFKRFYEKKILV